MHPNATPAADATLDQHQHAWADYNDRLNRAATSLTAFASEPGITDAERNRLTAKAAAVNAVQARWETENTAVNAGTTLTRYTGLWASFAQQTFNDWVIAHQDGEAGNLERAAYATGLALAADYQRGYGPGIDSPTYIANWFAINTPT